MFSVLIPTYNNLNYLKLCIKSLKKNSFYKNELIFHINEGSDGTLEYLKNGNFIFSYSKKNEGVCVAFNEAEKLANNKYLVLSHDDMYFCPNWDKIFYDEINIYKEYQDFFLSGVMIQPFASYINFDCGTSYKNFNENKLLENYHSLKFEDFQGTHWQPSLVPKKTWKKVGGFSKEFSPGLGSDPDFNMKLWNIGVRLFKGLGKCKVYHFSSVTLRKKTWNNGAKIFLLKWGITIKFFKKYYLRSNEKFTNILSEPNKNFYYWIDYIKCKIRYFFVKILSFV